MVDLLILFCYIAQIYWVKHHEHCKYFSNVVREWWYHLNACFFTVVSQDFKLKVLGNPCDDHNLRSVV